MGPDSSHGQTALSQTGIQAAQILVLSDNDTLINSIQSLLQLSRSPRCEVSVYRSPQFAPEQTLTADCIFVDRIYGGRSPEWALNDIAEITSTLSAQPPRIILLADPDTLAQDLGLLPALVRAGVDNFLLRTEMSCQSLLATAGLIGTPTSANNFLLANNPRENHDSHPRSPSLANIFDSPHTDNDVAGEDSFLNQFNNAATAQHGDDWINHDITIDLDLGQLHITGSYASPLFAKGTSLEIKEWLALLTPKSREELENVFARAQNYQTLPSSISCHFNKGLTVTVLGNLVNIRVLNNGQGRVGGIEANLMLPHESKLSEVVSNPAQPALAEYDADRSNASTPSLAPEAIFSLPMTCLLLDEQGQVKEVVHNPLSTANQLPPIETGKDLSELLDEDQQKQLQESIKRTLNTGQNHQSVVSYAGDIGLRWLDTHVCKIRGQSGLQREVLWLAFDITEARRDLQEAVKKHERLNQILRLSPILFFEKSNNGHYRHANSAFGKLTGLAPEQILGRNDAELFDGPLLHHLATLEKKLLENTDETTQFSGSISDDEQRTPTSITWKGMTIKHPQGKAIESIVGFGMINHTKLAEPSSPNPQNTPTKFADLESARTSKLEQELEQASHYEASGIMQLDFNAMQTSVTNYTEMALNQKFANRQRSLLDKLEELGNATSRAKSLLENKIGTGESASNDPEANPGKTIEPYPLTAQIVDAETSQLPANLLFSFELDKNVGKAKAERNKFQQIVRQIVASAKDNAARNSNESIKSPHLTLKNATVKKRCDACGEMLDGNFIELAVHTKEPSLSKDDLDTLLNNAKQAMKKPGGTGETANIIALAHAQEGHAIIEHKNSTLSLKLLFKKVDD